MSWFKRFFCSHEVDMEKLDVPVCQKCGDVIPEVVPAELLHPRRYMYNPKLDQWMRRKCQLQLNEEFLKIIGKK